MSSKSVAAYLYCPKGKQYDFEQMSLNMMALLEKSVIDTSIQEVYADGWDDIPSGLAELTVDVNDYSLLILYTLEGIVVRDIEDIVSTGCAVYCAMLPGAGIVKKTNSNGFRMMETTMESGRQYHRDLRSLNIKVGMKNTSKHIGNVPYGHKRTEEGTLVTIPEKIELARNVGTWYREGVAVSEISAKTNFQLSARQIYGLMTHWGIIRA